MIQKDYLLRLIQSLFDAINRIVNCIDSQDIEGAKVQIEDSYKLLGDNGDYFLNTDCKELFSFFKSKEGNYLERVKLLGELFFLDAKVEDNENIKRQKIKKSQLLLEHYTQFSDKYSFEVNNKLTLIGNQLS